MDYVIEMLNITKEFPGIRANDDVTLQLVKGEIHALLGENGAGKSTLMSVLFGLYQPEQGTIKKNGKIVSINSPNDANALGIGMVHQHFKLVDNFTVLENIILGVEETKYGMINSIHARAKVEDLSSRYNLKVSPDSLISEISVGMQQRVEILKMLYRDNEVLIFDEPTAVLTPYEIEELMNIMKGLIAEGKSIIFITHKLNEIKQVADRCTVLRKGKYIGTVDVSKTSKEELSSMMVGRKIDLNIPKGESKLGETVLSVKNLVVKSKRSQKNDVNDVTFQVRAGEILCIAGIEGNGQSELVYALTGLSDINSGRIELMAQDIAKLNVRQRNEIGLAHIPEDRHKFGLVLDYSLSENMILKKYFTKEFQNKGFLKKDYIKKYSEELIEKYDVRSGQGGITPARSMSGGNQQKAIIAREVDLDPHLLIAVQPTRGLDVGAIQYIHSQIVRQRDQGKAVLLVSFELEEVMNLSDRIIVFYEGEIVGEFKPQDITTEELGLYMAGSKKKEKGGADENQD